MLEKDLDTSIKFNLKKKKHKMINKKMAYLLHTDLGLGNVP